jgi:hypothetical protein
MRNRWFKVQKAEIKFSGMFGGEMKAKDRSYKFNRKLTRKEVLILLFGMGAGAAILFVEVAVLFNLNPWVSMAVGAVGFVFLIGLVMVGLK